MPPTNPSVLLVDDRPENLLALQAVLSEIDCQLLKATSGEEALRLVMRKNPTLILLDVQMPNMDGYETARLIKSRAKSKHIPIIFLTAIHQEPLHVQTGYSAGAVDYVFKPIDPQILRSKVQAHLQHQNYTEEIKDLNWQYEQKGREHYQQYQTLFHATPSMLAVRNRQNGRYVEVNQSFATLSGHTLEQVRNEARNVLQLRTERKTDHYDPSLIAGYYNERVTYLTKDGQLRYGLLSTEDLSMNGQPCVLCVLTDITERACLEREMARLERLRIVGELAAGLAHEIRNPIAVISGLLQIALLKSQPIPLGKVQLMLDETNRVTGIITQFLSLSRDHQLELASDNLPDIIRSLTALIESEAFRRQQNIRWQLQECPMLQMDSRQIRQLILNLAINGLESMDAGGTLTVHTYPRNGRVVLEIQDEGEGIAPDVINHIWTPFFTTKDTGTGLGLAVCNQIASQHGATISVDSGDWGSRFIVELPLVAKESMLVPANG